MRSRRWRRRHDFHSRQRALQRIALKNSHPLQRTPPTGTRQSKKLFRRTFVLMPVVSLPPLFVLYLIKVQGLPSLTTFRLRIGVPTLSASCTGVL